MSPTAATTTTALAASLALVVSLAATCAALPKLRATPEAPTDQDKDKTTSDGDKKYDVKREHYSPQTGRWEARDAEGTGGDSGLLFTVAHRVWPKSADFQGHLDYTNLTINSHVLIELLRLELSECEASFEDTPEFDAQDPFLHLDNLRATLATKEKEAAALKAAKSTSSSDGSSTSALDPSTISSTPEPGSVPKSDESDEDEVGTVPTAPRTAEEVALEVEHLSVFIKYLEELFGPTKAKLDRLLSDNVISYNLLWAIIPTTKGSFLEAVDEISQEKYAFQPKSCSYLQTRDGPVFNISGTRIVWNGTRFARTWVEERIPKFKGLRKVSSLSAHPISDKRRDELTARGRLYVGLARVAFMSYSGSLIQAEGRAVVDIKGYRRLNPSQSTNMWDEDDSEDGYTNEDASAAHLAEVSEDELCLLPPCVFGFSLVQREWGEMRVDQFTEVVFNDEAYEFLVMDPHQKDLIRSLVAQNSSASKDREKAIQTVGQVTASEDLVAGKGGGLVIALHGRPGTGKTLTAEAIAELLHVPLYAIGAGELGVNADVLEKRLRDILDVGGSWGAVLLIDEADVFLEERSLHDVTRNAMVSVFLRLLEYHSGILVLTTNRIRTVDPAFLSRFSIALTYPDLDVAKRRTIWSTFLERAGARIEAKKPGKQVNGDLPTPASSGTVTPVEVGNLIHAKYLDRLAAKPFNGRSIKNTVRTAAALASSKGVPLAEEHLDIVVKVSETFLSDVREPDEDSIYDANGEGWKSKQSVYS
ncbi:hypothetical protein RQP46_007728 [Phenoliferia psychrophenolica]